MGEASTWNCSIQGAILRRGTVSTSLIAPPAALAIHIPGCHLSRSSFPSFQGHYHLRYWPSLKVIPSRVRSISGASLLYHIPHPMATTFSRPCSVASHERIATQSMMAKSALLHGPRISHPATQPNHFWQRKDQISGRRCADLTAPPSVCGRQELCSTFWIKL